MSDRIRPESIELSDPYFELHNSKVVKHDPKLKRRKKSERRPRGNQMPVQLDQQEER
jgi:hypothetical protein